MKHRWFSLRLLAIVLWVGFGVSGSVVAQEEDATPDPSEMGTPGLVDAADNLNLPLVPPPPGSQEAPAQGAESPILPDTPAVPITEVPVFLFPSIESQIRFTASREVVLTSGFLNRPQVDDQGGSLFRLAGFGYADNRPRDMVGAVNGAATSRGIVLAANSAKVIASETSPRTGVTVTAFSNGTFVGVDGSGATILTGHFAYAPGDRMIGLGERSNGSRFAIYNNYFSLYTADGDVVIGNRFSSYTFDYDQDGNLLSVTDSEGGLYDVADEGDGVMSVEGPDGYIAFADETGAFELYDEDDNLVAEGDLADANHDDLDDFAVDAGPDDAADSRGDAVGLSPPLASAPPASAPPASAPPASAPPASAPPASAPPASSSPPAARSPPA